MRRETLVTAYIRCTDTHTRKARKANARPAGHESSIFFSTFLRARLLCGHYLSKSRLLLPGPALVQRVRIGIPPEIETNVVRE